MKLTYFIVLLPTAVAAWAFLKNPASPYQAVLGTVNDAVPGTAAKLDPEAALTLQRGQLDDKVRKAEKSLIELKDAGRDIESKRAAAAEAVKRNDMLLADARALWNAKASKGAAVVWVGIAYTPTEFHTQIESLFNETPALKQALSEYDSLATEIGNNIANMAGIRTQLTAARDRLVGQVALYHVNKLVGDFHAVIDESRNLLRSFDVAASDSESVVKTVRSGVELKDDLDRLKKAHGEATANPALDAWLAPSPSVPSEGEQLAAP